MIIAESRNPNMIHLINAAWYALVDLRVRTNRRDKAESLMLQEAEWEFADMIRSVTCR